MPKSQMVFGTLCFLLALFCILFGLWKLQLMVCVFGSMWLLVSCLILQPEQFWKTSRESQIEWPAMWGGLLTSLLGGFIIWMSLGGDPEDDHFHAPRFVVGLAGAVFFLAGVLVVRLNALKKALVEGDVGNRVLLASLLSCFAFVACWAAFGPGDREGTATISTPLFWFPFRAQDLLIRIAFSPGALILVILTVMAWVDVYKQSAKKAGFAGTR